MELFKTIKKGVSAFMQAEYQQEINPETVLINTTKKEFKGEYTVVVFPYTKLTRKKPEDIGAQIGAYLSENFAVVDGYNVIKGFLNLELNEKHWLELIQENWNNADYGKLASKNSRVMVEYSSPNTNKPLHLGHIRNILLGWSCAKILEAAGYEVVKTQIVNDRGIHICKSMLAWSKWGNGETPNSNNTKGDHLIGRYYVLYSSIEKEQKEALVAAGKDKEEPAILQEVRELLLKWEAGDPETIALWKTMNGWVMDGFEETYKSLGVSFNKNYFESETYLLGKQYIDQGLTDGIFQKKEDGSTFIDLTDAKLDTKTVLRADGTSLYITQDIGTAQLRHEDWNVDKMIYVVGDEQNYHFKVLFEIMKRLKMPYAEGMYHLSYGMVDLPTGKMKSREGTVVDADQLIAEVIAEVKAGAEERGGITDVDPAAIPEIYRKIGLGALKYFILKVNPQKRMLFDPKESVDLQGNTGPYIQNAYVRILSILRKTGAADLELAKAYKNLDPTETGIALLLAQYPTVIADAAKNYDPSLVGAYCYDLAKAYHKFYHDVQIMRAESEEAKAFRILLSHFTGQVLASGMLLLGAEMPERM
jgi:arginyl-tRNA synthetase